VSDELDAYDRIADFYDCEHQQFRDDIDFYLGQIEDGPVLEIGAGTGRITAALAANGHEVVGVDPSEGMLTRARMRLQGLSGVSLVRGTISDLPPGGRYGAVLFPLNVLWHFPSAEEQVQVLGAAGEQLRRGGHVYVDLSNPLNLADRESPGQLRLRFRGPCDGGVLDIVSAAWDDVATQTLTLALTYDVVQPDQSVARTHSRITLRYIFRAELELMAQLAGIGIEAIYGDYEGGEYFEDSPRLLMVGRV